MIAVIVFLWFCVTCKATRFQSNETNPVIDLGYASYRGVFNAATGINTFYGLRYAAPPIGGLRWRPPMNTEEYDIMMKQENIDATKPGPACIQGMPAWANSVSNTTVKGTTKLTTGEDCLRLDVYVPANPPSKDPLPVMLMIHGGGYTSGHAGLTPGGPLISHSKNSMIVVSIQYRLGAYGFLASKDVRADGTANAGLLDQFAAITWVQNHISVFGGDSEKVTIMGSSAGGASIVAQLMLYGGAPGIEKPPFAAAIIESPWMQPYHSHDVLEVQYKQLLEAAGCNDLRCLRNTTESKLATAAQKTFSLGYSTEPASYSIGDSYWGPTVDGDLIHGLPSREFEKGAFSSVPLLINHATFEGTFHGDSLAAGEERGASQNGPQHMDGQFSSRLAKLYPREEFNSTFWQGQAQIGDSYVKCPTKFISDAVTLLGKQVFKMVFNAGTGRHAATTPFLFEAGIGEAAAAAAAPTPRENAILAQAMKDYFVSFAKHQDPNKESFSESLIRESKAAWPAYGSSRSVLNVDTTQIRVNPDPDINARCEFWQSQSGITRN